MAQMKKRDRLEVIHDILRIIREKHNSILPTPLQRTSNLSTKSFNEYMTGLIDKGFVKEIIGEDHKKYYTLTDKGFRYLDKYSAIIGFLEEFEM
jgi:predicted transcriptional regulator